MELEERIQAHRERLSAKCNVALTAADAARLLFKQDQVAAETISACDLNSVLLEQKDAFLAPQLPHPPPEGTIRHQPIRTHISSEVGSGSKHERPVPLESRDESTAAPEPVAWVDSQKQIVGHKLQIKACVQLAEKRNEVIGGRLQVGFSLIHNRPTNIQFSQSPPRQLADCLKRTVSDFSYDVASEVPHRSGFTLLVQPSGAISFAP